MPPAEVTESEINNQVEMLLNYRATFEDVEGRCRRGEDYVTVDLKPSRTPTTLPPRAVCSSPVATATPRSSMRP